MGVMLENEKQTTDRPEQEKRRKVYADHLPYIDSSIPYLQHDSVSYMAQATYLSSLSCTPSGNQCMKTRVLTYQEHGS